MENITQKQAQARMILELAMEHKKHCNGECTISLYMVGMLYGDLLDRKLTDEESKIFS